MAACLAKTQCKVLHIDDSDFYGEQDGSISYIEFKKLADAGIKNPDASGIIKIDLETHGDPSADRHYSLDISVPKVLFGRSPSVDYLIHHDVSKYLSFASVTQLRVKSEGEASLIIPTTRNSIFQNKELKLSEKRALMNLFKSSAASASTAIESSASFGQARETSNNSVESMNAVEYLTDHIQLKRPELVSGIIHACCLYTKPAEFMPASLLLDRLKQFVSSLTQYEEGNPFLVPMYGNSDIAQSFARTAAVAGAVYILSCDETALWTELKSHGCDPRRPQLLPITESNSTVFHGIACCKSGNDHHISLTVLTPKSFDEPPIFALTLPNSDSGVIVCPPGLTVFHFVQTSLASSTEESFKAAIDSFLDGEEVVFKTTMINKVSSEDPFSLEFEFEVARKTFNSLMGKAADEPLSLPQTCSLV